MKVEWTGFMVPERWLVEVPTTWTGKVGVELEEYSTVVGRWRAGGQLEVVALRGALLAVDFSRRPTSHAVETPPAGATLADALASMSDRVRVLASLSLCLHSALLEHENHATRTADPTHEELVHFVLDHVTGDPVMRSGGIPPVVPGVGVLVPWLQHNGFYSATVLQTASERLGTLADHPNPRALDYSSLLNRSLAAVTAHEFSLATALSWSVCELMLSQLWDDYVRASSSTHALPTDRGRIQALSRLTAATQSEVLAMSGAIGPPLLESLNQARRLRNKWMHSLQPVQYNDASLAVDTAARMIELVLGVSLRVAPIVGTAVV